MARLFHQFDFHGQHLPVLDGIDFAVGPSEFVALLGPSGCGKSTLLRLVAGLERPRSGRIFVRENEIGGPDPSRILVFQDPMLYPWRTVRHNVALGQEARGELRTQAERIPIDRLRRQVLLYKARIASQCNRLGTALDLKSGKDCRDLVAHGSRTAAELLSNRLVIEAARAELQDLILARNQNIEPGRRPRWQEIVERRNEMPPSGLAVEKHVVLAFEGTKAPAIRVPTMRPSSNGLMASPRVQDQCGTAYLRCKRANIVAVDHLHDLHCRFRRCHRASHVDVGLELFRRCIWQRRNVAKMPGCCHANPRVFVGGHHTQDAPARGLPCRPVRGHWSYRRL